MADSIFSTRLTPEKIAGTDNVYSIPIYQRLFEWDKPRITQLLDDMYRTFIKSPETPYYIGMLTSNDNNELIDGQQRFTVTMLLGIAMTKYDGMETIGTHCIHCDWKGFLKTKRGRMRLTFSSRDEDNSFLRNNCSPSLVYENQFMKVGLDCIQNFLNEKFDDDESRKKFSAYVYSNMSLFISKLPNQYSPKALNKYFETMNSTGKNLENHEILKVRMLQEVCNYDKVILTRIWNAVSDMDQYLIRQRKNEKKDELIDRFRRAYEVVSNKDLEKLFRGGFINQLSYNEGDSESKFTCIGDIAISPDKPERQRLSKGKGFHSIISFSEFLLQVLWLSEYEKRDSIQTEEFFDVNKLQNTFNKYWNDINADDFILTLLRYRLLYDYYVITISNDDSNYNLRVDADDSDSDEMDNPYDNVLKVYESMLFVNSSSRTYYFWLPELLRFVDGKERSCKKISCKELYQFLKRTDEKRHPSKAIEDISQLSFKVVDRYWFWKLDFIIWQKRHEIFTSESARKIASNYVFRRNRSIEHIAPQTPKENSTLCLSNEDENCFGNLVMISSSQNSGLQNSTFEMKRSKVIDFIHNNLNGTIESLKMLLIYQYENWTTKEIYKHQEECVKLLKKSFEKNE